MSRTEEIQKAINEALRAGDKMRVNALRLMKAELVNLQQEKREEISDPLFWQLLNKMRKRCQDSAAEFKKAQRHDLMDKELFEAKVIEAFLPPQLDATQIAELVAKTVTETDAKNPKDIGKVMGKLKDKLEGRADMRRVVELVKNRLQKKS